jgi:hypothetical protein
MNDGVLVGLVRHSALRELAVVHCEVRHQRNESIAAALLCFALLALAWVGDGHAHPSQC